jgi:hypothetical protein
MKKQKINFVNAEDWAGLYIDGKLVLEDHNLHWGQVLEALGIDYESDTIDEEWMEKWGRLPSKFKEVKLEK